MKKFVMAMLILCMLIPITSLADTYVVTTETDPLNVRDATRGGSVIGSFPKGAVIEGCQVDKYWVKVCYEGQVGYCFIDYLTPTTGCYCDPIDYYYPSKTYVKKYTMEDVNSIWIVNPDVVKDTICVYAENSTNSKVVGRLGYEDFVYVITVGKDFTKVLYNGHVRYVLTKNIKFYYNTLPGEGELCQIKLRTDTTLRVWSKRSEDSTILTRVFNGMYVELVKDYGTWSKVYYSHGNTGYVLSKYLEIIN